METAFAQNLFDTDKTQQSLKGFWVGMELFLGERSRQRFTEN